MSIPFKDKSLFFAPMEGVTDECYRSVITALYPEWDYISTDFLRISTVGMYPDKHMIKHYGKSFYDNTELKAKTIYQILTSESAYTAEHAIRLQALGFDWLDINLGCPSKTVCKNKGGSYLLSDLPVLKKIIKDIRNNFHGTFTAKIRVGYRDDSNFENILKTLEDSGVDAITIHARTRDELYKGVANWDYVKEAVKMVNIPIVGNGDIWSVADINRYFDYTNAHSVMIARGALKTPWMAREFKAGNIIEDPQMRINEMVRYYQYFYNQICEMQNLPDISKNRRLKSISRYIFDPLENGLALKKSFLLSKSIEEMFDVIQSI
jgi:tRNA-dihydrouridine synthase B